MRSLHLLCLLPVVSYAAEIPRTADGKPDFSGVWQTGGVSLYGEVSGNTRSTAAVARSTTAAPMQRPDPPPYQPWAAAKAKDSADGLVKDDPIARCLLPGVPRIFSMPMPFQVIQGQKQVAILYEAFHAWRIVPFAAKHPDDPDPSFMGDSIAHWDGDTLVTDVIAFNGKTWLDGRGHFTTPALHITERYRLNGDTVSYEATAEDPGVMTKPWTTRSTFTRLNPGERPLEYECTENNQDIPHLAGPQVKAK